MAAVVSPQKSTTVRKNAQLLPLRAAFAIGSWLMPEATLQRAFRLFGTPMPGGREKARRSDTWGASVHAFVHGRERVAWYAWGDPGRQPVALLAHGWSGYALQLLPWVEPLRRAGYAVVALDQIAHGRSSGYRATLPMFADVLHRFAGRFGKVEVLVAHSLGGAAAMIAQARGLRAERTVLIAPAADPIAAAQRFGGFVGLATHLSARLFDEFESLTGMAVDGFQAHLNAPRIASPALIVHDLEDREVPWSEGERYARYWPEARLLSTTGLGHHRILTDPGVIAAAMSFLDGRAVGQRVVSTPNLPYGFA